MIKKLTGLVLITSVILSCSKPKSENLFNGKDLNGWYSWLGIPDSSFSSDIPRDSNGRYFQAVGMNQDQFNVFSVVKEDGKPAIRISGEIFGILVTENEFENYHLSLEFKWGEKKYAPRLDKKKDSGILYHSVGQEGAWGGVWMKSKEFQVQESDLGDFIVVDTGVAVIPCEFDSVNNLYFYKEEGTPLAFTVKYSYCHKSADYEKETGRWNKLEIYTLGDKSVHLVNGKVVLRAYHLNVAENGQLKAHTRGKIQLQSEGAEVFYRNIRIENIDNFPDEIGRDLRKP